MKSKLILVLISIVTVFLLFYVLTIRCYKKMPEVANYNIISNTGKTIPAKLYLGSIQSKNESNEPDIDEFILCFNDSIVSEKLNVSCDEMIYKYLIIIPKLKMIGMVEAPNLLEQKDAYICQSGDEANNFTSIFNNYTFFNDPPVKEAVFTDKKISFNTYGVLKQFGDYIVINVNK